LKVRFDQLAKGMFTEKFVPMGAVAQEHEIAVEPQKADIWFQPAAGGEAEERARHGLFGRMAETSCMVEAFHATPTIEEALDCLSKRGNLHRKLRREAMRQGRAGGRGQSGGRGQVPVPRLWIVSSGRPEEVIRGLELRPLEGWPPGFWEAAPLLDMRLVVLRELPETRETLLLRVLGRGKTFERAMHELHALPKDAPEAEIAIPMLLAFRVGIVQDSEEDEMQTTRYTPEMQAIYDDWEKRVKHTAWKAGEEAGRKAELQENLRLVYQARFGALPPEVQAAIESMEDVATLQQWVVPFATVAPEALAALVRGG
jgi:hypothetical protein